MKVSLLKLKNFLSWKSLVLSSLVIGVGWIVVKVSYQTQNEIQNQIIIKATCFGMNRVKSKDGRNKNI